MESQLRIITWHSALQALPATIWESLIPIRVVEVSILFFKLAVQLIEKIDSIDPVLINGAFAAIVVISPEFAVHTGPPNVILVSIATYWHLARYLAHSNIL